MNEPIDKTVLYALWLPLTDFDEFCINLDRGEPLFNSNWFWITFNYKGVDITIDSLGFIFLDHVYQEDMLDEVYLFLVEKLNRKSRKNITHTFLNRSIGYIDTGGERTRDKRLVEFLKTVTISFNSIEDSLKFEHIDFNLSMDKTKLFSEDKLKFSIEDIDDKSRSFHTILNRNFESLIKKGIFFTHGLHLENGELYHLSVVDSVYKSIEDSLPLLTLKINGESITERSGLVEKVIEKIIQDTIEERIILNFLHKTKVKYLSQVINEIAINNDTLKKLNSYLLEEIKRDKKESSQRRKDLDDESASEIFIQNLLQVIPKFHMIDSKIQEAYYIKIGNTTTNLKIAKEETILNTLDYKKWKASIDFCINTANKVKESLTIYHQNKTLRELENIAYNANYQADIEDIRELKKSKAFALDESSKKILLFIAIVTLAGEAPLLEFGNNPYIKGMEYGMKVFANMGLNFVEIFVNFIIYSLLVLLLRSLFKTEESRSNKRIFYSLWYRIKRPFSKEDRYHVHTFEDSDYDKHEHRSNHSLYVYDKEDSEYKKVPLEYNHLLSSYTLIHELKKVKMVQNSDLSCFTFHLFPKLLRDVPIGDTKKHIYRENYRISGNDRVATKIMYRYKINDLRLKDFLEFLRDDDFMREYENYLRDERSKSQRATKSENNFVISEAIKSLTPHKSMEDESKLTLYIVYSFVLKFDHRDAKNENIYLYTVSKDQFRVHYHINKLDYKKDTDFEQKQANLAKLVDIYFLKRLKRFKEVDVNLKK